MGEDGEDDGVNVDEDLSDEEIGRRFTKLQPEKKQPKQEPKPKQAKFNAENADAFPSF